MRDFFCTLRKREEKIEKNFLPTFFRFSLGKDLIKFRKSSANSGKMQKDRERDRAKSVVTAPPQSQYSGCGWRECPDGMQCSHLLRGYCRRKHTREEIQYVNFLRFTSMARRIEELERELVSLKTDRSEKLEAALLQNYEFSMTVERVFHAHNRIIEIELLKEKPDSAGSSPESDSPLTNSPENGPEKSGP